MSRTDISTHILPASAAMIGACITAISIVRLMESNAKIATIIDNVLAVDSIVFLASAVMSYLSLRRDRGVPRLERYADFVFVAGLLAMVVACVMLAWEFGHFTRA